MYTNRELFRADGHEWFDPTEQELEERSGPIEMYLIVPMECRYCRKELPPQSKVMLDLYRERGWKPVGYGMDGSFTDWEPWKISRCLCFECGTKPPYRWLV